MHIIFSDRDLGEECLKTPERLTGNSDTADNNAAPSPEQQKSPGTTVAAPVTPYMNSAALNEIAGELLVTVRELRDELLQVSWRNSQILPILDA